MGTRVHQWQNAITALLVVVVISILSMWYGIGRPCYQAPSHLRIHLTPAPQHTIDSTLADMVFNASRAHWLREPAAMASFADASNKPPSRRDVLTLASESKSQDAEDEYAYTHFFFGQAGGSFLEMGALDGVLFSNTYALEKMLGWRGVLIEASPSSYGQLVFNRQDQVTVHVAVCNKPQIVHYADSGPACCRGIAEFMSESFLKTWHAEISGKNYTGLPEVPCAPLNYILGQFGIKHVNFFSLDVEGAELEVLRAIDFASLSFDVIVIEADGTNPEKDKGVLDILISKGYAFHGHVARNDWFVRSGFRPLAKPS